MRAVVLFAVLLGVRQQQAPPQAHPLPPQQQVQPVPSQAAPPAPPAPQPEPPQPPETPRVDKLAQATTVDGETICMISPMRTFYGRRQWKPAWNDASLAALRHAIDNAATHGLDPQRYHAQALGEVRDDLARDVLATDAFLRLGSNLAHGAVDPEILKPAWCADAVIDMPAVLQSALDNNSIETSLEQLGPHDARYQRLRGELESLATASWRKVDEGKTLRRGDHGPRVAQLRERLGVDATNDVFDEDVDRALRVFQTHHGLRGDGVAGRDTVAELNVTPEARRKQIIVNLERWRWMPRNLGPVHVIVNIAGFRLHLYQGGTEALSMNVIVGKLYHETPFFAAKITDVTLNPWWSVPERIADDELRPKIEKSASYLAREHMVVTSEGRIRQRPGPWNSLGRVKFEMDNRYNVYLHDTPAKSLFDSTVRTFSHGCIRIERPLDLADFLLSDQPKWNRDEILATVARGQERTVKVTTPVPVYVLYWTAWPAADGDVEYHRDVYGADARVAAALE
jgi:murein L,D-transpeptidase YcbB/YkuD